MESWVPLFDIFLNSPTPETKASLWLQQSFNSTSSSSSSTTTTSSFLSLLTKPLDDTTVTTTKRVMYIQTLPNIVQSRILSFLAFDSKRFCGPDLARLARHLLSGNQEIDFWVKRAARNLLGVLSVSNFDWIYGMGLDSGEEERVGDDEEEFESLPPWLKIAAGDNNDLVLPWLPISQDELNSTPYPFESNEEGSLSCVEEFAREDFIEVGDKMEIDGPANVTIEPEILVMADGLRTRVMNFESSAKTVGLANEIRQLCLDKRGDCFVVLGLIEPWKADDETASVLMSHLLCGSEGELAWPSQVLCSIVLPKLLVLEEPASRVLVTATIECCKLHQRAAVYALLFPLILRREGISHPICDVITRIVRECLHSAHVSAFCQKLLCGGEDERRFIILPCHQCLISDELVWTESLFNLIQNILNHNIQLTQDSVDHIVYMVQQLAERFSKSLKFGNFLLCLVTKCTLLLKSHKLLLTEAVQRTNTLVTKSILSKLANF